MSTDLSSLESVLKSGKLPLFQDVKDVFDMKSKSACGENVNFVGEVLRVRCGIELTTGEKKYVNIIVKKEPSNDQPFTSMYHEFKIYEVEIEMYEKVLYNMDIMLKESFDADDKLWPNYYGHCDKDILLEDLSDDGYISYPKGEALGLDEALLVLRALGQFHGLSLSLIQRSLFNPSNMIPNTFVLEDASMRQVEIDACNYFAAAIETSWGPEWQTYPEKLRKYGENVGRLSNKLWHETRGKLDVINHGDCWINNILFKHNETGVPVKIKFVDYQASHYNSYSWDLTCILFSAILPSVREVNLDLLLTAYLENLTKYSTNTGYNGRLPSLEEVKEELIGLSLCGLIRSIISYSLFLNPDAMTPPDTASSANDDEEFTFRPWHYKSERVRENLEQTLIYFSDKNIL